MAPGYNSAMSILNRIMYFARSPKGRQMTEKAMRYAQSPEGRRRIAEARQRVGTRRKPLR